MKNRIWELDALRGLCILGVVVIHTVYDLVELFGILKWDYPVVYELVQHWGGVLFLLISGICVTLGSHSVRRGLIVFGCGLVISAVTVGMYYFGMAGRGIIIYFGVLHCLGVCMILWQVFRKMPWWGLGILGTLLAGLGLYFLQLPPIGTNLLVPLGLVGKGFASSDYFPLLPHFGFFLLGACLGRTVYRNKTSLFPKANTRIVPIRFLMLCGKHSLWIYLIHQPVVAGVCYLIMALR